jgi:FKBP-type peptidyl-prolyl cis-trans isomerase FklB
MKTEMTLQCLALLVGGFLAVQVCAEESLSLKTEKDKENYAIGVNMMRNFKQQGVDIDLDVVMKGMKDALSGGKLLMTEADLRKTTTMLQNEMRLKQRQARTAGVDNKREGDAFLTENKKKEGVVTLPSGLQYKILKAGDGKKPTDADTVECRYRGTFMDGTEFDSSVRSGQPATLKVAGVIPGWREALKLMPVGSRWQLFIPPQLAYGARGAARVGPNVTLIFELDLLAIK